MDTCHGSHVFCCYQAGASTRKVFLFSIEIPLICFIKHFFKKIFLNNNITNSVEWNDVVNKEKTQRLFVVRYICI